MVENVYCIDKSTNKHRDMSNDVHDEYVQIRWRLLDDFLLLVVFREERGPSAQRDSRRDVQRRHQEARAPEECHL